MPRLKPQPEWMSMMIKNRIKAAQRRMDMDSILQESLDHVRRERVFEQGLGLEPVGDSWRVFGEPLFSTSLMISKSVSM